MNKEQFKQLSSDLNNLVTKIPLKWGRIQNDKTDSNINMFDISEYEKLEERLKECEETTKNYFRRRWYIWKCSECDEYLFVQNDNVTKNPNSKDQTYDFEFNSDKTLRFDLKGTVIPKSFKDKVEETINDPTSMVQFFYSEQSKGVRRNYQNRLFLVHHSYDDPQREILLRCNFDYKEKVFVEYAKQISKDSKFIKIENVLADVIFILEKDGNLSHKIHSLG